MTQQTEPTQKTLATPDNLHTFHPFLGDKSSTPQEICDEINKALYQIDGGDCRAIERIDSDNILIQQLQDTINWIATWIERGIYGGTPGIDALKCIAYSPVMPWNQGKEWDVDHLPYAEQFYKDFPEARPKK